MSWPVALQLYSVREQAEADLRGVLKEVAGWGYDGVEFAGLYGHAADEVRAWLDEFGLKCEGAHMKMDTLEDEARFESLDDMKILGGTYIIVPWLLPEKRNTTAAALASAEWFTELHDDVVTWGFFAGFHFHQTDLDPLEEGGGFESSAWHVIARNTPDTFIMQYDTANGMAGGLDAAAPLRELPGRTASLHLKSYAKEGHGKSVIGPDDDVPWREVLDAARTAGTEWLVIEQEAGHPTLDPMAAAKASLDGLRSFL